MRLHCATGGRLISSELKGRRCNIDYLVCNMVEDRYHVPHVIDREDRVQELTLPAMLLSCNIAK